jgi:hypothetical protein
MAAKARSLALIDAAERLARLVTELVPANGKPREKAA